MFKRQTEGSVVCASCGTLVGVNDDKCYSCGRRNPGLWGYARSLRALGDDLGFVNLVVFGCSAVYVISLLLSLLLSRRVEMGGLGFFGPTTEALITLGASGALPVFQFGRWWTVLSAPWLHAGILHIFFNMMMLRQLGPPTADLYGAGRMVIIYIIGGIVGFACSSVAGSVMPHLPIIGGGVLTVGASAPIFGLLGGLMYYSRRGGSSLVRSTVLGYVVSAAMFGILMPGIDNYAHAGGFLGGYLAGRWLDPLRPERMDHFIIAGVLLLASALSIVASVVTVLPELMMILRRG